MTPTIIPAPCGRLSPYHSKVRLPDGTREIMVCGRTYAVFGTYRCRACQPLGETLALAGSAFGWASTLAWNLAIGALLATSAAIAVDRLHAPARLVGFGDARTELDKILGDA